MWTSAFLALAAAAVLTAILIGNTGANPSAPLVDRPAWVYHERKHAPLTPKQRADLLAASLAFVQSAVVRKRLDSSYDMVAPELKEGMTRKDWRTGNIPVVPFPAVGLAGWKLDYSYANDVAFDLALVAKPGSPIVGKTFTIELKHLGAGKHGRWLVVAWVPRGISSGTITRRSTPLGPPPKPRAALGVAWLLVPLGILGLIVLIPLGLALRGWIRNARARRAYRDDSLPPLESYKSSSNPS